MFSYLCGVALRASRPHAGRLSDPSREAALFAVWLVSANSPKKQHGKARSSAGGCKIWMERGRGLRLTRCWTMAP